MARPDAQTALETALDAHLAGHLDAAAAAYDLVIALDPLNAAALHYSGVCLHAAGRPEEGIARMEKAAGLAPGNPEWRADLHAIFSTMARRSDARGDAIEASRWHCRAFVLPPHAGKSHERLGTAFYFLGRVDEAAEAYRAWLAEAPDNPTARHLLAACSRQDVPARASDRYIESHFDRFAEDFDTNLVDNLDYQGPRMIALGLRSIDPAPAAAAALDLGCGTGLCGPVLAPFSRHITGVDLAAKMLDKARQRSDYAVLEKTEILDYLGRQAQARAPAFDLVVAADTLIYFGDLGPVFQGVSGVLHEGGHLVFTIEAEASSDGSSLHASGRYRHGSAYVKAQLQAAGFTLLRQGEHRLRQEVGEAVSGFWVVARKEKTKTSRKTSA